MTGTNPKPFIRASSRPNRVLIYIIMRPNLYWIQTCKNIFLLYLSSTLSFVTSFS